MYNLTHRLQVVESSTIKKITVTNNTGLPEPTGSLASRVSGECDWTTELDLLREKKILLIHGGGFNWQEPDHFRVVYLPRIEVLSEAVEKIGDFLSTYRQ